MIFSLRLANENKWILFNIAPAQMNLLQFLASSPSPFHAISSIEKQLISRGFVRLFEKQIWSVKKGGNYYVIRNGSSIIAFTIGALFVNFQIDLGSKWWF